MNTTRQGSRYVREVLTWLESRGLQVTRRPWREAGDDLQVDVPSDGHTIPLSIECKNLNRLTWAEAIDQAERNSGNRYGVVFAKRRGKRSVDEHYVVMRAATFMELIR
jgi:hypothetical protein